MALRDQPYLPLYVNDFLSDERLVQASAESTGVYIRIMCIMHKSDQYGKILLNQNQKKSADNVSNFASVLTKQMPYDFQTVKKSLEELLSYNIIAVEGDMLTQKRMVKDNEISLKRAEAGKKGGAKSFAQANAQAKLQANPENENDISISIWENEKKSFKNSGDWIFNICRSTGLHADQIEELIDIFLNGLDLKEDYKTVKELKKHFVNWMPKNLNASTGGKEMVV